LSIVQGTLLASFREESKARLQVLRRLGHVAADGTVLLKGRAACEIDTADELLTVGECAAQSNRLSGCLQGHVDVCVSFVAFEVSWGLWGRQTPATGTGVLPPSHMNKTLASCCCDLLRFVTAELMFNGCFHGLDKHQLLALVSCLTPTDKTNEEVAITQQLADPLRQLQVGEPWHV
jgi:superfamily II RNA helicase